MNQRNDPTGLAAVTFAVLFFGTGNVLVKLIQIPGLQLVLWRLGGAAILYLAILLVRRGTLTRELMVATFWPGFFFAANLGTGYVAIKYTSVANASVIGSLQPLFIVAFVSRRFGEAIDRWLLLVAPVAFAGVALVVLGSSDTAAWSLSGDLLAFGSMLLWVAYFASAKKARETTGVIALQAASLIWATVLISPLSIGAGSLGNPPTGRDLLLVIGLLLIPGTGHALVNWAHNKVEISIVSLMTLGIPVVSSIGALLFLDEPIVALQVVGMAVVIGSLAYTVRRS